MQDSCQIPKERAAELLKEAEEFVLKESLIFELQQEILVLKAELKRLRDGESNLIDESDDILFKISLNLKNAQH